MELKRIVHQACIELLEKKIESIKTEVDAVQESAISDTKSSMGDKYETGREVMMQERNRLSSQMDLFTDQLTRLNALVPDKKHNEVRQGSLVRTDKAIFYLSVAIGQLNVNDKQIFAISSAAPLAKGMIGKKEKDSFSFNNVTYVIQHLE
jgi:transcription elongation GreA/GreB family factor